MAEEQDQIAQAFEICKIQASADGAFDEVWLRHIFQAAWDLCAAMVGLMPPTEIREPICIDDRGWFKLSHKPTSEVQIFDGYKLITVIAPNLIRTRCHPALCCLCHPYAVYMIGNATCDVPATFIQAVARLFAYMIEHRGDAEPAAAGTVSIQDDQILAKSGALAFLRPDLEYVA